MNDVIVRHRFTIPARPLCVNAELLALEPDSEVGLIFSNGEGVSKASVAIETIQALIQRQSNGFFTLQEASEIMALSHNLNAKDFLTTRMRPAAESRALAMIDPRDGGPVNGRRGNDFHDWVTSANMDKWLESEGFTIRWPPALEQAPKAAEVTQAAPAKGEPVSVFAAQELELLRAIHEAGYKPTDLPMRRSGHPGAKAEIRARLKNHRLFVGEKKFNKAWERLRASGGIRDSSSPALG